MVMLSMVQAMERCWLRAAKCGSCGEAKDEDGPGCVAAEIGLQHGGARARGGLPACVEGAAVMDKF